MSDRKVMAEFKLTVFDDGMISINSAISGDVNPAAQRLIAFGAMEIMKGKMIAEDCLLERLP